MKTICPNLRNKEVKQQFDELKDVLGEDIAYYVWSYNNGYSLDYAPDGAQSKLFSDLLEHYKGDRQSAIIAKARTYSPQFRNWFGDWTHKNKENVSKIVDENNEPLIVYHSTTNVFDTFDINKSRNGYAIQFKPWKDSSRFGTKLLQKITQSIDIPVYLNIKNPAILDKQHGVKSGDIYTREKINKHAHSNQDGAVGYSNVLINNKSLDISKIRNKNGVELVVFDPNQIKSIDNRGTFSIDDNNIYNYNTDSVEYNISNESSANIIFSNQSNAKESLNNMINSGMFFLTEEQMNIANNLYSNLDSSIKIEFTNINTNYDAAYQNGKILVNPRIFGKYNNQDIGRIILHELVHHFTIDEYNKNSKFKNNIDSVFNKISNLFSSDKYNRKNPLYYGLTSPAEFISELYTNSAFRDLVAKKNMSTWRRLLTNILNALNLNKIANKVAQKGIDNNASLINEIQSIINNTHTTDYVANDLGDGILKYDANNDDVLDAINKEARNISEKILRGLKASYKSLKSRDKSPIVLTKLQQTIDQYELDLQKNDDTLIITNFIKRASEQFKPVLNLIRKAYLDNTILSNDEILNFKNDFLDFYGPMCEEINKKLFLQDYFANLDPQDLNVLETNINLINRAYTEISGKYDRILRNRSAQIVSELGELYGVPTEQIEEYIQSDMQKTIGDINFISLWLRPNKNLKDFMLRLSARAISDINNEVQMFANDKAQSLIRSFQKINKSDQLLYFEKDKDGKTTGYLVRDRRYGEFKNDLRNFSTQLDQKYGVVDGNYYVLNDNEFYNYLQEKEEWLQSHCERRFKSEYYNLYSKLKSKTRLKLKSLNGEIQSLIESVTDKQGVHLEKMSDKNWNQLDKLYQIKRNLSNLYNFDGTLKVGDDREIAEDLMQFYDELGFGKIKSLNISQDEIEKLVQQKEKELTPDEFQKWKLRNISYSYSDEFIKLIQSDINLGEHQKEYEDLLEKRRMLMSLGRNNNLPRTEAKLLNSQIKQEIKELDQQIDSLRSLYGDGTKSNFGDFAKMVTTQEYEYDKKKAKEAGDEAYKEWYDRSHYINSRGNEVIVSYYRMMVPKDTKYIEVRLSRMNQELDKNSELINPNYDFENPEYYQPKKDLYDNTEAYKKATNTIEKQEIYNLILSTIEEANSKIPFLSKRDNYKLPQITGDIVDFTMRGNKFWKGIMEYSLDGIFIKNDDADYAMDNFTQKPDGSELKFIPTHYIEMLKNPEHISRNMVGLLTEYSKMAENYRIKNQRVADFEVLAEQMANRTFVVPNMFRRTLKEKKGNTTNTYQKLIDFIDMQMYGQLNQPLTSKPFGKNKDKQVSFSKIINKIKNYASASNLSWNMAAITKSFLQGMHKSTVEALAGRYFDKNQYYKLLASKIFKLPTMLYHMSDPTHNDLTLALLENAGIARDLNDKVANMQYNRALRFVIKNIIWGGWSAIDYMVKAPVVEAIYADYKYIPQDGIFMSKRKFIRDKYDDDWKKGSKAFNNIKSFTLLDVYTVKDGILVIKDQYKQYENVIKDSNLQNSVINVARFITNRIDGVLSSEDKTRFMTNAFGASVMMHRSFFINNMEDNAFAEYQYNPYIEDYYEAKYRSSFKVIWNWMSNLYNGVTKVNTDSLNKNESVQIYNFKRTMIQLALIGMYTLLVSLWLKPEADDDKKSYLKNFIGYCMDAMRFEEFAEYNPFDLFNQIKSPSAAIAPVENVTNLFKLFDPIHFENNFKEINKGPYKGMERWQRNLIKVTPGLRGIWESKDPRTKWEYLETQLDK